MSVFWIPTIGQRVRVRSLDIKGTVEYIDMPNIYRSYMYPVQITLDQPYKETEDVAPTTMFRCGVEDLKKLVKKKPEEKPAKKKKKKEASFDDMVW